MTFGSDLASKSGVHAGRRGLAVGALLLAAAFALGQASGSDLQFTPFTVGSANTDNSGYFNAGIDLEARYRNLRLLGSISPDFRTVEDAILSLDFSYFERLPAETRPFFLNGLAYYSPTYLATQRIDTFNAGGKLFGNVDPSTRIGLLETANFWDTNQFVLGLSHQFGPKLEISAGVKDLHDLSINNRFGSGRVLYTDGPISLRADVRATHDDQQGDGNSVEAQLAYAKGDFYARVKGVDTSPNFLDRLGYFTETDVKGIDAAAGVFKPLRSGPISGAGLNLFTSQYQFRNGAPYRNYVGGNASLSFRNGTEVEGYYTHGYYLQNKDDFGEVAISRPAWNDRIRFGVDLTEGRLASAGYHNALLYFALRPTGRLQMAGSVQTVQHFGYQSQSIFRFNYLLAPRQTLSGRLVQYQNNWNFYLRYANSVSKRVVYEVLLGDPNTLRFQKAIWLKLEFPMEFKF